MLISRSFFCPREHDHGEQRGSRTRTVGELVERWLEWRQQVRPIFPVTVANYHGAIDLYILPTLGRARVGEVLIASGVVRVAGQPLIDKDTKTHAKRRVAVGADTVELLKTHRARQLFKLLERDDRSAVELVRIA